jgi:hypothetical protein
LKGNTLKAYEKHRAGAWTDIKLPSSKGVLFVELVGGALAHFALWKQEDTRTITDRLTKLKDAFG